MEFMRLAPDLSAQWIFPLSGLLGSVNLRRVDPDNPRFVRSPGAVAVGERGLEEEGVAGSHQVGGGMDGKLDGSGHEIADRFALMCDETDLLAAWSDQVNIGLEQ